MRGQLEAAVVMVHKPAAETGKQRSQVCLREPEWVNATLVYQLNKDQTVSSHTNEPVLQVND